MLKDNSAYYDALEDGADIDDDLSPALYEDVNHTHELSARFLAERAGTTIRDLGPTTDKKFKALINPEVALPTAYLLAVTLYQEQQALSTGANKKALVTAADAKSISIMNAQLQRLLDEFMIRTPVKDGKVDEESLLRQEGEESLGFALQETTAKILKKIEDDKGYCDVDEADPAVVCEALGRLCEREVKRIKATHALESDSPRTTVQAGRIIEQERTAPLPLEGRSRGGNAQKKPE